MGTNYFKSKKTITSRKLLLEFKNESLQGDLTITRSGYSSLNKRNYIINEKEDEILNDFETKYPNLEVDSFDVKNLYNPDKKINRKNIRLLLKMILKEIKK